MTKFMYQTRKQGLPTILPRTEAQHSLRSLNLQCGRTRFRMQTILVGGYLMRFITVAVQQKVTPVNRWIVIIFRSTPKTLHFLPTI